MRCASSYVPQSNLQGYNICSKCPLKHSEYLSFFCFFLCLFVCCIQIEKCQQAQFTQFQAQYLVSLHIKVAISCLPQICLSALWSSIVKRKWTQEETDKWSVEGCEDRGSLCHIFLQMGWYVEPMVCECMWLQSGLKVGTYVCTNVCPNCINVAQIKPGPNRHVMRAFSPTVKFSYLTKKHRDIKILSLLNMNCEASFKRHSERCRVTHRCRYKALE